MILKRKSDIENFSIALINQKLDNIQASISRLNDKIMLIEEKLKEIASDLEILKRNLKIEEVGMPLSKKNRELIKILLKRHGKLTSKQVADLLGISRTRAVEYLVEMEREGIVEGKFEGKKKYYYLKT